MRASISGLSTATLTATDSPSYREIAGTVISDASVPLATKLMSRIEQLNVDVGDSVTAGQLLVVLDDSEIVAMRNEAGAMRAEARAALMEVSASEELAAAGVSGAESGLSKAQTALADAERDLGRSRTLFEEGVIPRSALDKAELARDTAADNVLQAEAALEQARAAVLQTRSRTPQVESREMQAAARDSQAAALQDYASLRAPFDGVVTARYFEPGQLSVPGAAILTVAGSNGQRVMADIPQEQAERLALGQLIQVAGGTDGGQLLEGTLVLLSATADAQSQTRRAEIALAPGSSMRSGEFVRIRLPLETTHRLLVAKSALVREGEADYVWRISSTRVLSRVAVEAGIEADGKVEILRGLAAGDEIVLNPGPALYEGARAESGPGTAESHEN